ncbi:MAG: tRNA (N(6)-L-threonylcarbamoyladenosine(37)-C(2))-methylthiotransferase MtaB [Lachnospiraceae bacterium]|nr:tRNA (N(6)-L-threonylcarbamoyladenosine(37)-C(2))-methylthiotransferase MtaB [Lachnospiraceae bacterium]
MKKAALHNLGCKVNAYEMDVIRQLLLENDYEIVPFEEKADIYIVNTCTVTNIADRKSRQMLHRAKECNPEAVVVAVGCYVQTGLETALKDDRIDLCIGNDKKGEIVSILAQYLSLRTQMKEESISEQVEDGQNINTQNINIRNKTLGGQTILDIAKTMEYEDMQLTSPVERCRAFIKIQDGCNQFCSYCIIPHARGRVRSRQPEEVLLEIRKLAGEGYQEFVITGIHLSSYGSDWEEADGISRAGRFYPQHLLCLLQQISAIQEVRRIRLGSLEPRIVTEDFAKALSDIPKLCPHFHLSLQSGCDATLKRMNRHYTTEEYAAGAEYLRRYFEHPAITTDVIAGFPGETEEEFQISREYLQKMDFFEIHVFKYSRRQHTPAATMPGQLTEAEKASRSEELLTLTRRQSEEFRNYYIGRKVEVLFEEQKVIDGRAYWIGHTPQYVKVAVEQDMDLHNQIIIVEITGNLVDNYLYGMIGRN